MKSETRRLGPYQLIEPLGSGGMGDVFKAQDTRLDRTVAIKFIKPEHAERFRGEAKAISSLNHPHICTLYDVGEESGIDFLVMEYLEGVPLPSPLPPAEALRYALQIADALIAAHRKGIVHRDLKPGNIMLTASGVKLLDFGLAKVRTETSADGADTISSITGRGDIVGTLHYMSPEQVSGLDVDVRSDIFSFGQVLYEMFSGRRGVEGTSHAEVMASILRDEPRSLTEFAPSVPAGIDRVIRKCLRKNPAERWQSMEAVRDALEWAAEAGAAASPAGPSRRHRRGWPAAVAGASVIAMLSFVAVRPYLEQRPSSQTLQVELAFPPQLSFGFDSFLVLSPDGRRIIFNSNRALWMKSLEDGSIAQIPGTAGGTLPFWSPDGQQAGFFAEGKLKILTLSDGHIDVLCDAPNPKGGAWGPSGEILFSPRSLGPLYRVPARGGAPTPASVLDESRQETEHSDPVFLPDGRRFLYLAQSRKLTQDSIVVGSLDGGTPARATVLMTGVESGVRYWGADRRQGWLLFRRQQHLMAQAFDPGQLRLAGSPVVVARDVRQQADKTLAAASVARDGTLLVVTDPAPANHLRWVGRDGTVLGTIGEPGEYLAARLSPDGRRLATVQREAQAPGKSIWIVDLDRNVDSRVTSQGDADDPVWSPDGSRLAYAWHKGGEDEANLFVSRLDRAEEPGVLVPPGSVRWPLDWSRDGRFIIFAQIEPETKFDLWMLPVADGAKPTLLVRTPGKDNEARFSPDGRLIAFQSDHMVETRVYVRALEGGREQVPVSEGHGAEPRWRGDGRELYYISGDGALMAVPIAPAGPDFRAGRPIRLFGGKNAGMRVVHFDNAPDGKRFLVIMADDGGEGTEVRLLLNWRPSDR